MQTRREFVRNLGAVAVAGTVVSKPAAAEHPERQPDHVTIEYEPSVLERYQPLLDISQQSREKLLGLYGWVARSPEHDTAVCVYWCSYSHQEAPWWAPETGHFGDREPIQVEFDTDSGEVARVRASIFHWLKGEVDSSEAVLDGTNPTLRVIEPHHQYTAQPDASRCTAIDVDDLTGELDAWLDNGLEAALQPGACHNPWIMRDHEDFWAPGEFGLPFGLSVQVPSSRPYRARIAKAAGFGVAGEL